MKHVWLVDPAAQTLEVMRYSDGLWTLIGSHIGAEKVPAEPFDAIALDLAALWQDVAPGERER